MRPVSFFSPYASALNPLRFGAAIAISAGVGGVLVSILSGVPSWHYVLFAGMLTIVGALLWVQTTRTETLQEKADELNASELRLRQVAHFRQHFLANMSHEFRTPLNAIQGFSQAILHRQGEMSEAEITDYVQIIDRSAKNLGALTDNVLDLSRLDAPNFELAMSEIDLTRLVSRVVGRYKAIAIERGLTLTYEINENWIIRCEPRGLRKCLDSLISNALNFTEDGGRIELRVRRSGRDSFVLEVIDDGCGIAEEDLKAIWTVYARSSMTKKSSKTGAGLGLAVTRSLMQAHGGYVEIDSELGQGTTVRLRFPGSMIVAEEARTVVSGLSQDIAI